IEMRLLFRFLAMADEPIAIMYPLPSSTDPAARPARRAAADPAGLAADVVPGRHALREGPASFDNVSLRAIHPVWPPIVAAVRPGPVPCPCGRRWLGPLHRDAQRPDRRWFLATPATDNDRHPLRPANPASPSARRLPARLGRAPPSPIRRPLRVARHRREGPRCSLNFPCQRQQFINRTGEADRLTDLLP